MGPGPDIRRDRTQSAAWPLVEKENGHTRTEKDRPTQKNTSKPKKKKSGLHFYLLLLLLLLLLLPLLYTFLFHDLKALKLKKNQRQRKTGVRIRPSLARYGLGTRIRATLARILIPGLATDPRLRIRGPGACLRSTDGWTFGLFLDFLTDSFDLNFTWKRYALWLALRGGNCVCV